MLFTICPLFHVSYQAKGSITPPQSYFRHLAECGMCGKNFSNPSNAKRHMKMCGIPKDQLQNSCSTCGKKFTRTTYKKQHEENCFKCRKCSKIFNNLVRGVDHEKRCKLSSSQCIRTHQRVGGMSRREWSRVCGVCGRKFKYPCYKNKHQETCAICPDCGESYNENVKHRCPAKHVENQKCVDCGRAFRTHKGQCGNPPSFKCRKCGERCEETLDLYKHMVAKHEYYGVPLPLSRLKTM